MAHHADDGLLVEEAHGSGGQFGNVDQCVAVGTLVDEGVGNVLSSLGRVDDMHGPEVLVFRTDTDDLVDHLDGI